jgi:hypothetical protein
MIDVSANSRIISVGLGSSCRIVNRVAQLILAAVAIQKASFSKQPEHIPETEISDT